MTLTVLLNGKRLHRHTPLHAFSEFGWLGQFLCTLQPLGAKLDAEARRRLLHGAGSGRQALLHVTTENRQSAPEVDAWHWATIQCLPRQIMNPWQQLLD